MFKTIASHTCLPALLLLFGTCLIVTPECHAQPDTNTFSLAVSGDAGILASADDPMMLEAMIKRAMWRFDNVIEAAFSRPAFELGNDASSAGTIVGVDITIGDPDFNFDEFVSTGTLIIPGFDTELPPGVVASVTDFDGTAAAAGDAAANVLSLDFTGVAGGGLLPGESLLFNAQLASDVPSAPGEKPSFDEVFFGADFDASNNSLITVTFADPDTGDLSTSEITLEDILFTDLDIANHDDEFRFFGLQSLTQAAVVPTSVIPEPATAVQVCLLLATTGIARRRSRS